MTALPEQKTSRVFRTRVLKQDNATLTDPSFMHVYEVHATSEELKAD